MKLLVIFALCVAQILIVDSKIIPNHFPQPCSKSVPNYSDCTYKVLQKMGPYLLKGVREINFPRMHPLDIPLFIVNRTLNNFVSINAVLKNLQMWGFDQTKIENFKFDPENLNGELSLHIPLLRLSMEYEVSGRFFEFPLDSAGYFKVNSTSVKLHIKFGLKPIDKLGVKYFAFKDFKIASTVDDSVFNLATKNPEDQAAVDAIVNFINGNFKLTFNAFQPIYEESVNVFYKHLAEEVFNTVPANELIPE